MDRGVRVGTPAAGSHGDGSREDAQAAKGVLLQLTARELEVVALLDGRTYSQVGVELEITASTVRCYVNRIASRIDSDLPAKKAVTRLCTHL